MTVEPVEDEVLGQLRWLADSKEWEGYITLPPHEEAGLLLPQDYFESEAIRDHIRDRVEFLKQNEARLRERAVHQLHDEGDYLFWWLEDEPFDFERFLSQMMLATSVFEPEDHPSKNISLWYGFDEFGEHAALVILDWDGNYQYARCA
jgi:hypothetical protein